jgi:hypothetical protein
MAVINKDVRIARQFADVAVFSSEDKTAISVRDGVIEYLGSELNLSPSEKVFTVYRSPATIANAAQAMLGIPLTDEHVDLDEPRPDTGSTVEQSKLIDQITPQTNSFIAILNKISISDAMMPDLTDKRELSLGYHAELISHDTYDFEQINIIPHHLAAVPAGRCGSLCSFIDRKLIKREKNMKFHKSFLDAEGKLNLEQIAEIATALPEAMRKVPVDEIEALRPALMQIMSYAKESGVEMADMEDEYTDEEKKKMADMEKEKKEMEDAKCKDADDKKFADALNVRSKAFADVEVKRYSSVINKARQFLDDDYEFSGKSANNVMRDSLSTQSTDKFEDAELSVAFKLLRKTSPNYSGFGDNKNDNSLSARIAKDLGEA